MDRSAAKSYYVGYDSIDRFSSIVFIHNYLFTWSIALISCLILPLLFIVAPSSLHTTRTSHFLIVCIVCLSNMGCLYVQLYMISNTGDPLLSFHTCRFIVYISTFTKPIGLYLTLLFSIERLFTKVLSRFLLRISNHRQLFKKFFTLSIFISIIFISSFRLFDTVKLITRSQSVVESLSNNDIDLSQNITDTNTSSTDLNVSFQYCFSSIDIDEYAKMMSFYVIQYWFEYLALVLIILILLIICIHQFCLSRIQQRLSTRFSVNTKLYLSLSSCVILSELIIIFFHYVVDDPINRTGVQLIFLQMMLFAFNLRTISLPLIICLTTCDPLKQFLYELFIIRPYLDNIDETDNTDAINDRPEPFSSAQRTSNRIQQNLRRTFTKNNKNNHDYLDNDESQADL